MTTLFLLLLPVQGLADSHHKQGLERQKQCRLHGKATILECQANVYVSVYVRDMSGLDHAEQHADCKMSLLWGLTGVNCYQAP